MGQLIKLQDYVSRYEQDIYRYPSQFVRLKTQQWNKLKAAYLSGELENVFSREPEPDIQSDKKDGVFDKVKGIFKKNQEEEQTIEEFPKEKWENAFSLHFSSSPANLEELKISFLNQLLRFQLKWGSSTIFEKSYIDQIFFLDEKLKFFLQRFPDTFLVLYKPVFLLKNAPVEVEVILLSPTEALCLTFLEGEEDAAFLGSNERFWIRRHHKHPDKKLLNPTLSVNRTEKIVRQLFSLYEVNIPVKKAIISRNGYIDYPQKPYSLEIYDKRTFPEWFKKMRNLSSPLKNQQLKGAQALLEYCQTTSSRRMEWDVNIDESNDGGQG